MLATCRRVARDANQMQLLESIERDLYSAALSGPSARHTCARRLREALRVSPIRTARPAWRAIGETAACSRSPLAASYTSMPRLGMLRVHSGRPLERAPRLARAHRAARACPSATRIPSPVPSGRFIACDLPPYAARDANQRQLLESIERDPLLRRAERHPGAPYMRWPPSPGALLLRHSSGRPLESAPRTLLGLNGPLYCSAPLVRASSYSLDFPLSSEF